MSTLKKGGIDSLNKIAMGTAVTNLMRMDFQKKYGARELGRLIMNPGGAFPLANVNLVIGAVTCAGKLRIVMEYAEETVDCRIMRKIKAKGMELLHEQGARPITSS